MKAPFCLTDEEVRKKWFNLSAFYLILCLIFYRFFVITVANYHCWSVWRFGFKIPCVGLLGAHERKFHFMLRVSWAHFPDLCRYNSPYIYITDHCMPMGTEMNASKEDYTDGLQVLIQKSPIFPGIKDLYYGRSFFHWSRWNEIMYIVSFCCFC